MTLLIRLIKIKQHINTANKLDMNGYYLIVRGINAWAMSGTTSIIMPSVQGKDKIDSV